MSVTGAKFVLVPAYIPLWRGRVDTWHVCSRLGLMGAFRLPSSAPGITINIISNNTKLSWLSLMGFRDPRAWSRGRWTQRWGRVLQAELVPQSLLINNNELLWCSKLCKDFHELYRVKIQKRKKEMITKLFNYAISTANAISVEWQRVVIING